MIELTEATTENDFDEEATGRFLLRLTPDAIMQLGISLGVAVNWTKKEIDGMASGETGKGFVPGAAFKTFLTQLQDWATSNDLPDSISGSEHGDPPFCAFVGEVNRSLPLEYRETRLASPQAVAKRIQRIRKGMRGRRTNSSPRNG